MPATRKVVIAAIGTSLLATAVATAVPPDRSDNTSAVKQQLIARTAGGGAPNAPAGEPTISWDGRVARYVAYTSTATNIRPGTNGRRNVFLVTRGGGGAGAPWTYGSTTLASAGLNGAPANGDSFSPALGGWTQGDSAHKPRCLAFVSNASNLVARDANNRADVFIRSLPSGTTRRIASPAGKSASDVAVSGDCRTFAIVAGGSLYLKRPGSLKRLTSGGVRSPRLTFNGAGLSYAKRGRIYVRARSGGARRVASGSDPAAEGGKPSSPRRGRLRSVAYKRGGVVHYKHVGGRDRRVGSGTAARPSAGGGQVMFGSGPYVYLYAVSNSFGKKAPQGFCPSGQGNVTETYPSGRGNYIVFSCSAGRIYLSYLGGK
ncbi:MAG: hypothetical protein M3401_08050 [Actinomycetota bacterium]|nr:hypothetical protein [Actinomycetota bacterium]